MRNVVLFMHMSLDGYIAGPGESMDWITVDDAVWAEVLELQKTADAALFGRVNYQGFESFWPTAAENPGSGANEVEHAKWLDAADKVVFSTTLEAVKWKNTRIVRDDVAGEVQRLKQQPGKDMILFGGANIAQSLLKQGLVDEFRLNVNPVILGSGKRLFEGAERLDLKLSDSKQFENGVVALHYVRS